MKTTPIRTTFAALLVLAVSASGALAQEGDFADTAKWVFTNGPEFPGAAGSFSIVEEGKRNACAISYDFTGGGSYVAAGLRTSVDEGSGVIKFSVKDAQPGMVVLRVMDASGECFQFKKSYTNPGEWEDLRIDVRAKPVESWGGDANKTVDFPLKSIWFGVPKGKDRNPTGTLYISDLKYESN